VSFLLAGSDTVPEVADVAAGAGVAVLVAVAVGLTAEEEVLGLYRSYARPSPQ